MKKLIATVVVLGLGAAICGCTSQDVPDSGPKTSLNMENRMEGPSADLGADNVTVDALNM